MYLTGQARKNFHVNTMNVWSVIMMFAGLRVAASDEVDTKLISSTAQERTVGTAARSRAAVPSTA